MNLSTVQIFTMPHWMAAAITGAVKNWLGIVTPALPQQPELVDKRPTLLTNLCWWRLGPALLRTYTLRTVCRLALDSFSIQIYEHGPPAACQLHPKNGLASTKRNCTERRRQSSNCCNLMNNVHSGTRGKGSRPASSASSFA